jgi:hypothetical protein
MVKTFNLRTHIPIYKKNILSAIQTPYVHPTEKKCFFLQKNIFHVQISNVSVFVTIFVRKSLPLKMKPVSSGAAQLF